MAQVIQGRFPRPTFHAAPVQHVERLLSVAHGGPPFRSQRHADHRRISAVDCTEAASANERRDLPGSSVRGEPPETTVAPEFGVVAGQAGWATQGLPVESHIVPAPGLAPQRGLMSSPHSV